MKPVSSHVKGFPLPTCCCSANNSALMLELSELTMVDSVVSFVWLVKLSIHVINLLVGMPNFVKNSFLFGGIIIAITVTPLQVLQPI